jgi:hypothetical protein
MTSAAPDGPAIVGVSQRGDALMQLRIVVDHSRTC